MKKIMISLLISSVCILNITAGGFAQLGEGIGEIFTGQVGEGIGDTVGGAVTTPVDVLTVGELSRRWEGEEPYTYEEYVPAVTYEEEYLYGTPSARYPLDPVVEQEEYEDEPTFEEVE